ncbi:hypothetical protein LTR84_010796 [Exophiala bonariae]|uniref:ATP-dependent DNA ligase family profile domain-containing protein n=1 Tax=Exophiala bonariae TaxID=1690606 RepID=A0AAV9NL19_9EURO|nr:hypothetical protein LTR84_010796 [Exophiala bonariae]
MPGFKFKHLVNLLEDLEKGEKKNSNLYKGLPPLAIARAITEDWFKLHNHEINRIGPSALAFLSCLLPHRLSHRTYGLRERRLGTVVADALYLPEAGPRRARLKFWTGERDFATLVAEVLGETENLPPSARSEVTLEEIDAALLELAAKPGWPGHRTKTNRREILHPILKRLSSQEIKWLMRMILKSYSPALLPEQTILRKFHFILPELLTIQNSFEAALATLDHETLNGELVRKVDKPEEEEELSSLYTKAARVIRPILGVMVQRQSYQKARSMRHCIQISTPKDPDRQGTLPMQIERKYDGEYCQIHVDLSKAEGDRIKIFSKSGKDSTADREGLHRAIEDSLLLDDIKCPIGKNCILEGELLVWNREKQQIQPFHVIRKYVLHGGRSIGTSKDSPKDKDENLMIMYFDLLYIDDHSLLNDCLRERRRRLNQLIEQREGVCELAAAKILHFGRADAQENLFEYFTQAIRDRWEGLVVKSIPDPYFSWGKPPTVIKLKSDYVNGLEEPIDLCIVGGYLEQIAAIKYRPNNLSWTSFYLASFENKAEVEELNARPQFRIVDILHIQNQCISRADILHINQEGRYRQADRSVLNEYLEISFECKVPTRPITFFKEPFVVEVMGAGFDKPQDAAYLTHRFPRVKLHTDRTFLTTSSFDELQAMAVARSSPVSDSHITEIRERLAAANGRFHPIFNDQSQDSSSLSSLETSTPTTPPGLRTPSETVESMIERSPSVYSPSRGARSKSMGPRTPSRIYPPGLLYDGSPESNSGISSTNSTSPEHELSDDRSTRPVSAAQIRRRPQYIPDDSSEDVASESGYVEQRPHLTTKRLRYESDGPPEDVAPESNSAAPKRIKPNNRYNKLKPVSPPVVRRFAVDKLLQGLSSSEASTSPGNSDRLVPQPSRPSISQSLPRFHHEILNEDQHDHPQPHSQDADEERGRTKEYCNAPQDSSLAPLAYQSQSNFSSQRMYQPPGPSHDPVFHEPVFYDPQRPSAYSYPPPFLHPQITSEYVWQNPVSESTAPPWPASFPESNVRTPIQPQRSPYSHPRMLSDPRKESRAPLTEIPNAADHQDPSKSASGSGHGHFSSYSDEAKRKRENYYYGSFRGGASSPRGLIQSPKKKRIRCRIANEPCSKEKRSQILVHICRSPSSSAATSIGRILTSHWLILIVVADDSRPRDVAREIKDTSSAILRIREQVLGKVSPNDKAVIEKTRSEQCDEKLVIFLSKSARPVLSKIQQEMKTTQALRTQSRRDRSMASLSTAFKTYFAGAIHVSFPKPFFSPTMADLLVKEAIGSLSIGEVDRFGELCKATVDPAAPLLVTSATSVNLPTIYEDVNSKDQDSAEVIWKWCRVLMLMGSLGCDAEQV